MHCLFHLMPVVVFECWAFIRQRKGWAFSGDLNFYIFSIPDVLKAGYSSGWGAATAEAHSSLVLQVVVGTSKRSCWRV